MPMIDDLVGNADVFPVLARRDYFNHAGASPMARPVADAIRGFADQFQNDAFIGFDFAAPPERLRSTAARLINADENEIAIPHNTSEAVSHAALGLELAAGDRIVINDAEYPANVYPWHEAARRTGAEVVTVNETTDDAGRAVVREEDLLAAADHPKTRVLAVSHVQWGSGQRMNLTRLGSFCRERGILFSVDVIQSLGVVPIDVKRDNIDVLQAGGHKWMLGTMGAGVMYVRREWMDRIRPAIFGWANVNNPLKWEEFDFTLQDSALRYEYGTPPMASIIAVAEGLSLLAEVGIEAVHRQVKLLGDRFASGVAELGYRVVTRRDPGDADTCSGAVCFSTADGNDETSRELYQTLSKQHDTELAYRCGRVRFSPHFYNTTEQIDRLLNRLSDLRK